jgi:hypothetical protein
MLTSLDIASLAGGIVEELLHLPRRFESRFLQVKTLALTLVGAGVGGVIVASPWGRRLGVPVLHLTAFFALFGSFFVGQACAWSRDRRGRQSSGSGLALCCLWSLRRRAQVLILAAWVEMSSTSLGRGLGIGMDAGAVAPDLGVVACGAFVDVLRC